MVKPGDSIFMNDGYIELRSKSYKPLRFIVRWGLAGNCGLTRALIFLALIWVLVRSRNNDHELLKFAAEQKLDAVSQSFVLRPEDLTAVREAAAALNYDPFVIAKIERSGALENLDEIIEAADGIMVARGDLGVEIPIEDIPSVQKRIIQKSNLAGKPVITATQMLESMTDNRRPTRAEATDVANAILDGTDCVMLSGETAVGTFPIDTVSVMARIAQQTEANMPEFDIADLLKMEKRAGTIKKHDLLSLIVFLTAEMLNPIVVFSPAKSGSTARRLTRFRLPQWLVAPSQLERTCQELQFSYGIFPVYVADPGILAEPYLRRQYAGQWLRRHTEDGEAGGCVVGGRRWHFKSRRHKTDRHYFALISEYSLYSRNGHNPTFFPEVARSEIGHSEYHLPSNSPLYDTCIMYTVKDKFN